MPEKGRGRFVRPTLCANSLSSASICIESVAYSRHLQCVLRLWGTHVISSILLVGSSLRFSFSFHSRTPPQCITYVCAIPKLPLLGSGESKSSSITALATNTTYATPLLYHQQPLQLHGTASFARCSPRVLRSGSSQLLPDSHLLNPATVKLLLQADDSRIRGPRRCSVAIMTYRRGGGTCCIMSSPTSTAMPPTARNGTRGGAALAAVGPSCSTCCWASI